MKKEEIISLVKSLNLFGDNNADQHKKIFSGEAEKIIDLAFNDMIIVKYDQSVAKNNFTFLDNFTKIYIQKVLFDNTRGKYYSLLPVPIIPLDKNAGIRSVSPLQGENNPFSSRSNNTSYLWNLLPASKISNKIYYDLEDNILFYNEIDSIITKSGVLMKLVIPFSEYDYDDEIYLPGGYNTDFINRIRQQLQGNIQTPKDNKNDNNSNIIQ